MVLVLLYVVCAVPVHAETLSSNTSVSEMNMEQYFTLTDEGTIDFNTYAAENEGAGVAGVAGILVAGYFYISAADVASAKAPGRGIIMSVQNDLLYGGQTIWFSSQ